MRQKFILPSTRSLQNWLKNIPLAPGISSEVIMKLKESVPNMKETDKLCAIIFDEMKLKSHLYYNQKSDRILGFEDFASRQTERIADQAFVVMLKGIIKNWKQPIGYLLSHKCTPSDVIENLIKDAIKQLSEIGLEVKVLVCDQGACIFIQKTWVQTNKTFFILNEKNIYIVCMMCLISLKVSEIISRNIF